MLSNERSGSLFCNAPTGIPQKETGEYRGEALELLQKKWEQVPHAGTTSIPRGLKLPLQPWQPCPAGLGQLCVISKEHTCLL